MEGDKEELRDKEEEICTVTDFPLSDDEEVIRVWLESIEGSDLLHKSCSILMHWKTLCSLSEKIHTLILERGLRLLNKEKKILEMESALQLWTEIYFSAPLLQQYDGVTVILGRQFYTGLSEKFPQLPCPPWLTGMYLASEKSLMFLFLDVFFTCLAEKGEEKDSLDENVMRPTMCPSNLSGLILDGLGNLRDETAVINFFDEIIEILISLAREGGLEGIQFFESCGASEEDCSSFFYVRSFVRQRKPSIIEPEEYLTLSLILFAASIAVSHAAVARESASRALASCINNWIHDFLMQNPDNPIKISFAALALLLSLSPLHLPLTPTPPSSSLITSEHQEVELDRESTEVRTNVNPLLARNLMTSLCEFLKCDQSPEINIFFDAIYFLIFDEHSHLAPSFAVSFAGRLFFVLRNATGREKAEYPQTFLAAVQYHQKSTSKNPYEFYVEAQQNLMDPSDRYPETSNLDEVLFLQSRLFLTSQILNHSEVCIDTLVRIPLRCANDRAVSNENLWIQHALNNSTYQARHGDNLEIHLQRYANLHLLQREEREKRKMREEDGQDEEEEEEKGEEEEIEVSVGTLETLLDTWDGGLYAANSRVRDYYGAEVSVVKHCIHCDEETVLSCEPQYFIFDICEEEEDKSANAFQKSVSDMFTTLGDSDKCERCIVSTSRRLERRASSYPSEVIFLTKSPQNAAKVLFFDAMHLCDRSLRDETAIRYIPSKVVAVDKKTRKIIKKGSKEDLHLVFYQKLHDNENFDGNKVDTQFLILPRQNLIKAVWRRLYLHQKNKTGTKKEERR